MSRGGLALIAGGRSRGSLWGCARGWSARRRRGRGAARVTKHLRGCGREYEKAKRDRKFQKRLQELLRTYAGRPTPLFFAQRLTQKLGGAKIYLKREHLLHTGAHKINTSLGQ